MKKLLSISTFILLASISHAQEIRKISNLSWSDLTSVTALDQAGNETMSFRNFMNFISKNDLVYLYRGVSSDKISYPSESLFRYKNMSVGSNNDSARFTVHVINKNENLIREQPEISAMVLFYANENSITMQLWKDGLLGTETRFINKIFYNKAKNYIRMEYRLAEDQASSPLSMLVVYPVLR
jgi:hypothetical protein